MKKSLSSPVRLKSSWLKELALGLLIASIWMFFEVFGLSQSIVVLIQKSSQQITAPFVSILALYQRPLRPLQGWFQQTERLRIATGLLVEAETQVARLQAVEEENFALRQLLENRHLELKDRRIASVVATYALPAVWLSPNDSTVQPGSLVMYKDVLLGKVASREGNLANIDLLTQDDDFSVVVSIGDEKNLGVTKLLNGKLVVTELPPDVVIQPGQRVKTAGQPGVPAHLFVGITESGVLYENGKPYVLLTQLVSFYETGIVEILLF